MVRVSIIVPCYNHGKYLADCIESIIDQTYSEWECIIVDDGSLDHSTDVANALCKKDPRLQLVKKKNGGLSSARNFGIKKASGGFILPLDADDTIESSYLEKALKVFDLNSKTDLVYCRARYFGNKEGEWLINPYRYDHLLFNNLIFCSSVYKKSLWQSVGGYDENLLSGYEDWDFYIRTLNKNSHVVRLPEILFNYRIKDSSMITDLLGSMETTRKTKRRIFVKNQDKYWEEFGDVVQLIESQYMSQEQNSERDRFISLLPIRLMLKLYRIWVGKRSD